MLWHTLGINLASYVHTPIVIPKYDATMVRYYCEQKKVLKCRTFLNIGRSDKNPDVLSQEEEEVLRNFPAQNIVVFCGDEASVNVAAHSFLAYEKAWFVFEPDVIHRYPNFGLQKSIHFREKLEQIWLLHFGFFSDEGGVLFVLFWR